MVTPNSDMELQATLNNLTQAIEKLVSDKEPANPPHLIWLQDYAVSGGNGRTHQTTQAFLVDEVIITASQDDVINLKLERLSYPFHVVAGTHSFRFPISVDQGVSLSVDATLADVNFYLLAQVREKK